MERLTPTMPVVDAVLAGAGLLLPVREIAGNATPNDGYMVNAIQAATGTATPDPWCASFVYYVGRGVLAAHWPLPRTASCDVLLAHARQHGLAMTAPERGDLFLVMRTPNDATHVGFVTAVDADGRFRTTEGNSNLAGSREGDGVYARLRGGAVDRNTYLFVRWALALTPAPAAPAVSVRRAA
jgi:hypothetical protein